MTDRYNLTGNPEAQYQPGSNNRVLSNKLGINNSTEMDDVELGLLVQIYDIIPEIILEDQQIGVADIREWHRRWLGNVYVWAGQYRTLNMGKDSFQFASASQIARLMNVLDKKFLMRYTSCVDMSNEQLIEAIAIVHIELILIHPFREGNGRIARLLANVMAMQAGKPELDFSIWDKNKTAYFAAIQSGMSDYGQMKALVKQVLHDSEHAEDD
jgi:cell filamentation protein